MTHISRKYDMAKSQRITMPLKVDYQLVFLDSLSSLQAIESCKVENPLIDHSQLINSSISITFCSITSELWAIN